MAISLKYTILLMVLAPIACASIVYDTKDNSTEDELRKELAETSAELESYKKYSRGSQDHLLLWWRHGGARE